MWPVSPGHTCSPTRYAIQFGQTPARLKHIRVSMNVDHIDHLGMITIPRALKEINNKYVAGHFGKFGMYSEPINFGYDYSDGMTGNVDGILTELYKQNGSHNIMKIPSKFLALQIDLYHLWKNRS